MIDWVLEDGVRVLVEDVEGELGIFLFFQVLSDRRTQLHGFVK